jgi:hypothetical protein
MATIVTYRAIEEIDETTYWHLVPASGLGAQMFFNNAIVGKGLVHSVSFMVELDSNLANAQTPYSMGTTETEKERVFEDIRLARFSSLPSRLKAFYVFPSIEIAQRAQREWFASDPKIPVRAWIAQGSKIHTADAQLLRGSRGSWTSNAERYWFGHMTDEPFPEVLVHGSLYFPDWKSFEIPK